MARTFKAILCKHLIISVKIRKVFTFSHLPHIIFSESLRDIKYLLQGDICVKDRFPIK